MKKATKKLLVWGSAGAAALAAIFFWMRKGNAAPKPLGGSKPFIGPPAPKTVGARKPTTPRVTEQDARDMLEICDPSSANYNPEMCADLKRQVGAV